MNSDYFQALEHVFAVERLDGYRQDGANDHTTLARETSNPLAEIMSILDTLNTDQTSDQENVQVKRALFINGVQGLFRKQRVLK